MRLHGAMPSRRSPLARLRSRVNTVRNERIMRQRQELAAELLACGLVDREFLEAQLGRSFASDAVAATAWAATAPRLRYAPHPLWEPGWQQEAERSARDGERASAAPWRPAGLGGAADLASLGAAVSALETETVLEPSDPSWAEFVRPVTWAELRADALERAHTFAGQDARSTRRNLSHWGSPSADYAPDDRLVSVIMPVRNRARLIARAIASVRAQHHTSWELLVVDDGSTDDTAEVVEAIAALDPRVVLVRQEQAGVSAARNAGIARARGVAIAFLDSDNVWLPEHLSACLAHWSDEASIAVYSVVAVHTSDGSIEYSAHSADRASLLEGRNPIDLNALLVGRDALRAMGGFDETLRRWVDYDLVLRLSQHLAFGLVPVVGVQYDHRDDAHDRITTRESPLWRRVVLHRALVDSEALAASATSRADGIAVVIRNRNEWPATLRTVRHCLALDNVAEVVVIDAASTRDNSAVLGALALGGERLRVVRTAGDYGWTLSTAVASSWHSQRRIVGVAPGAAPTAADIDDAAARGAEGMVRDARGTGGVRIACSVRQLAALTSTDFLDDSLED